MQRQNKPAVSINGFIEIPVVPSPASLAFLISGAKSDICAGITSGYICVVTTLHVADSEGARIGGIGGFSIVSEGGGLAHVD